MLTEQQKNYLQMLLTGDSLTEEEIKLFLGRSGWSAEQVELGIKHSKENKTELPKSTVILDQDSVDSLNRHLSNTFLQDTATQNVQPEKISDLNFASSGVSGNKLSSDLGLTSIAGTPVMSQSTQKTFGSEMKMSTAPAMQTMPSAPAKSFMGGILKFIAWLLFLVLVCMIIGLVGYMYYMHLGPFAGLTYTSPL